MAALPPWLDRVGRHPLYALFALVAVAAMLWSFRPRAVTVEVARFERGDVTVEFVEEGRTRLRERFVVSSPLAGVLERVEREPGDDVVAGERLAVIHATNAGLLDPSARTEADARWRSAVGTRIAAAASLDAARAVERDRSATLLRSARLAEAQLVARGELDALRAAADVARADMRTAEAHLAAAETQVRAARAVLMLQGGTGERGARVAVDAPARGRIVRRLVESEAVVAAGQPLFEVGDVRELEIVVDVLTSDAVRIPVGTPVELRNWGGEGELPARVLRIEPGAFVKVSALGVEEQRVPVVLRLLGPAPAALGDGFRVDARFIVWHGAGVPSLPIAALFRDGEAWAVYAVERGRARLRRVEVGRVGEDRAQILSGLRDGVEVIVYPGDAVRDATRVRAAEAPPSR